MPLSLGTTRLLYQGRKIIHETTFGIICETSFGKKDGILKTVNYTKEQNHYGGQVNIHKLLIEIWISDIIILSRKKNIYAPQWWLQWIFGIHQSQTVRTWSWRKIKVVYTSKDQDIQYFGLINSRSAAGPWLASFWIRDENSSAWWNGGRSVFQLKSKCIWKYRWNSNTCIWRTLLCTHFDITNVGMYKSKITKYQKTKE